VNAARSDEDVEDAAADATAIRNEKRAPDA
jgi:hypothetical protein